MMFEDALRLLRKGRCVTRQPTWGRGFVYAVKANAISPDHGAFLVRHPNKGARQFGWAPTQLDLFASDWQDAGLEDVKPQA
jgi:hypothetical protein